MFYVEKLLLLRIHYLSENFKSYTLCTMHYALCSLRYALCALLFAHKLSIKHKRVTMDYIFYIILGLYLIYKFLFFCHDHKNSRVYHDEMHYGMIMNPKTGKLETSKK